jgi:hypothetical protein
MANAQQPFFVDQTVGPVSSLRRRRSFSLVGLYGAVRSVPAAGLSRATMFDRPAVGEGKIGTRCRMQPDAAGSKTSEPPVSQPCLFRAQEEYRVAHFPNPSATLL